MLWFSRLRTWLRDRDRAIFRYHDGRAWRWADPVVLLRGVEDKLGSDWLTVLKNVEGRDQTAPTLSSRHAAVEAADRRKTRESAISAADSLFGLTPLDPETGNGLTEQERMAVLAAFLYYIWGLAAAARPLPISRPSGSSPPPASPTPPSPDSTPSAATSAA